MKKIFLLVLCLSVVGVMNAMQPLLTTEQTRVLNVISPDDLDIIIKENAFNSVQAVAEFIMNDWFLYDRWSDYEEERQNLEHKPYFRKIRTWLDRTESEYSLDFHNVLHRYITEALERSQRSAALPSSFAPALPEYSQSFASVLPDYSQDPKEKFLKSFDLNLRTEAAKKDFGNRNKKRVIQDALTRTFNELRIDQNRLDELQRDRNFSARYTEIVDKIMPARRFPRVPSAQYASPASQQPVRALPVRPNSEQPSGGFTRPEQKKRADSPVRRPADFAQQEKKQQVFLRHISEKLSAVIPELVKLDRDNPEADVQPIFARIIIQSALPAGVSLRGDNADATFAALKSLWPPEVYPDFSNKMKEIFETFNRALQQEAQRQAAQGGLQPQRSVRHVDPQPSLRAGQGGNSERLRRAVQVAHEFRAALRQVRRSY
jgi:hypothetical protein